MGSPVSPFPPDSRLSVDGRGTGVGLGLYAQALAGNGGNGEGPRPPALTPPRAKGPDRNHLKGKAPRTEALAEELEQKFLPAFVAKAAASLPRHYWRALGRHLKKWPGGEVITLTIGTACSGSEFYLTALPLIAQELSKRIGRQVQFDHRWSCELEPQKRQWIMDNFSPKKLFDDITALAEGHCHDYVSGASAEVDNVDIIIAGTSCKDASRLNPHHMNRLDVVASGTHSTGGTFQGLARLVAKIGHRCQMVFLENVASLRDRDPATGRSNFDSVREIIQSLGFGFISAEFSALDMGLPVARPRLYMAGVRCADEGAAQNLVDEVVTSIARDAQPVPLDALLLREGSPSDLMRDWMPEGLTRRCEQPGVVKDVVWKGKHDGEWAQVPPLVVERVVPLYTKNPWFHSLPHRQQDLLLLAACRHEMTHKTALAIPLHTSMEWGFRCNPVHLPTLVPRGVFWLTARGRPLLGIEAVRLQGCDPCMLPGLGPERHDSAFLCDLAGNAFCVYQFSAWLFAALATGGM